MNGCGNGADGAGPGREDFSQVFRRVTAIDVAPGKIHHRLGTVQMLNPLAHVFAVPFDGQDAFVVTLPLLARENNDFKIVPEQFLRQRLANKSTASREHDTFFDRFQLLAVRQFQCQSGHGFVRERIQSKMGRFDVRKPFLDQPTHGFGIQAFVRFWIFFYICQGKLEQRGGGTQAVFLQMHKGAGELNQTFVETPVRAVPAQQP